MVRNAKQDKVGILLTFIIMFVLWAVLSTLFDIVHLSLGALCSLLVAYFSYDLLIRPSGSVKHVSDILRNSLRFFMYTFWLLGQVIHSNIDVVRIVLDPKLPISPQIIKFNSDLPHDVALATLANSITLTPGTLTLDIDENKTYYIHCLTKRQGDQLLEGDMQARVAAIYGGGS